MNRFGLRTRWRITKTKTVEVYQKPWSGILGIPFDGMLKYIVVENDNGNYTLIDALDEADGFETYGGAEQYAILYMNTEYDLSKSRSMIHEWMQDE